MFWIIQVSRDSTQASMGVTYQHPQLTPPLPTIHHPPPTFNQPGQIQSQVWWRRHYPSLHLSSQDKGIPIY